MRLLLLPLLILLPSAALAQLISPEQPTPGPIFGWGEPEVLIAEFVDRNTRVDRPDVPPGTAWRAVPAQFEVTIVNEVPEATAAIHAAADLWSTHIQSPVPIKMRVTWMQLAENVLGATAPRLIANFTAALDVDTWFATALASSLEGSDLNPDNPDLELQFNVNFAHWYFGVDGNPPEGTFDFLTVVIHEIGHGLGFVGSMRVDEDGWGRWGLAPSGQPAVRWPIVYDRFAETDFQNATSSLLDTERFPNPSVVLGSALQSEEVYFNSPTAVAANVESQLAEGLAVPPGGRPKLYAPNPWVPGSSFSHLTEERVDGVQIYYPPGSVNSLMTPRLGAREVIRTPGPTTCGMFRDMGWVMGLDCEVLLPDDDIVIDQPLLVAGPCPHPAVNGRTEVQVHVDERVRVRADLFDVLGRVVARVADRSIHPTAPLIIDDRPMCIPGSFGAIPVDVGGLASGMYFLRIHTDRASETVRIVHVR